MELEVKQFLSCSFPFILLLLFSCVCGFSFSFSLSKLSECSFLALFLNWFKFIPTKYYEPPKAVEEKLKKKVLKDQNRPNARYRENIIFLVP